MRKQEERRHPKARKLDESEVKKHKEKKLVRWDKRR